MRARDLEARAREALGQAVEHARDARLAADFADDAVRLAEEVDDPRLLATALDARLTTHAGPDDLEARLSTSLRLLALVRHEPDPEVRLAAHAWRLTTALEQLDLGTVRRQLAALDLLADETHEGRARFLACARRAMFALTEGDTVGAARLASEAAETGVPDPDGVLDSLQAELARQRGDRIGPVPARERARGAQPVDVPPRAWRRGRRAVAGERGAGAGGTSRRPLRRGPRRAAPRRRLARRGEQAVRGRCRERAHPDGAGVRAPAGAVRRASRAQAPGPGVRRRRRGLPGPGHGRRRPRRAGPRRLPSSWAPTGGHAGVLSVVRRAHRPSRADSACCTCIPPRPTDRTGCGAWAARGRCGWSPRCTGWSTSGCSCRVPGSTYPPWSCRPRPIPPSPTPAPAPSSTSRRWPSTVGAPARSVPATALEGAPEGEQAEQARAAVRKAIRAALARLELHDGEVAHALRTTIRIGATCRYEPDQLRPVEWRLTRSHPAAAQQSSGT